VKPDDITLWLPWMLTMLGTLIVITFTAWLNTRSVHAMIAELRQAVRADIAELRGGYMRTTPNCEPRSL
jgi:hypothetical protein